MNIFPNAEKLFKDVDRDLLMRIVPNDQKLLKNPELLEKTTKITSTKFFNLLYVITHCEEEKTISYLKKNTHLLNYVNKAEPTHKFTPLIIAIIREKNNLVEYLLKNKANPNKCDKCQWPPILHAAVRGHEKAIKLLLNSKADPEKKNLFEGTYKDILKITTLKPLNKQTFLYKNSKGIHEKTGTTFLKFTRKSGAEYFLDEENYFPGYLLFKHTWKVLNLKNFNNPVVKINHVNLWKNCYAEYKKHKNSFPDEKFLYLIKKPGKIALKTDQYGVKTTRPINTGDIIGEIYFSPIAPKDAEKDTENDNTHEILMKHFLTLEQTLTDLKEKQKNDPTGNISKQYENIKKQHDIYYKKLKDLSIEMATDSQYRINKIFDGLRFRSLMNTVGNGFPNSMMTSIREGGIIRSFLIATKPIKEHEEIFVDFGIDHTIKFTYLFTKTSQLKKIGQFVNKKGGLLKILKSLEDPNQKLYDNIENMVNDYNILNELKHIISTSHIIIYLLMEKIISPDKLKTLLEHKKLKKVFPEFFNSLYTKDLKIFYENTLIEFYNKIKPSIDSSKELKDKIFKKSTEFAFHDLDVYLDNLKTKSLEEIFKKLLEE